MKVFKALIFSPMIGFGVAAVLLLSKVLIKKTRSFIRNPREQHSPARHSPPDGAHLHWRQLLSRL